MSLLAVLPLLLTGCKSPPPAPQGLDDASRYLVREFYADDATFQAGVDGLMQWFDDEGAELVGIDASTDGSADGTKPVDAFTVADLTASDVAALPIATELDAGPDAEGTTTTRDLSAAAGVVSVAEMDCVWTDAEALLVRPDQDAVFDGDWEGYERTYVTSRTTFEAATAAGAFTEVPDRLDPFAADFDTAAYAATLLFTDNDVDPTPVLGVDIPAYPMKLDLRHGIYALSDGSEVGVLAILTYNIDAAWADSGESGLRQSFSIEVNAERAGGKTLRTLAVWAEPVSSLIEPDSAMALTFAVNKSLDSSNRISDVCSGAAAIE